MIDSLLAIVDAPFDVEKTDQPFGKRWGGDVVTLTGEHLAALREGKLLAVDVMNEYVVFLRLHADGEMSESKISVERQI